MDAISLALRDRSRQVGMAAPRRRRCRQAAAVAVGSVALVVLIARLGGDEFGLLLPDTAPDGANAVALALCAAIRKLRIEGGDGVPPAWTTASIGAATGTDGADAEELLGRADGAMYVAKRDGGDQVAVAGARHPVR